MEKGEGHCQGSRGKDAPLRPALLERSPHPPAAPGGEGSPHHSTWILGEVVPVPGRWGVGNSVLELLMYPPRGLYMPPLHWGATNPSAQHELDHGAPT